MTLDNFLRQTAEDIITILTNPPTSNKPLLKAGDPTRNALLEIATLLKRVDTIPPIRYPCKPLPRVSNKKRITWKENLLSDLAFDNKKNSVLKNTNPTQSSIKKLPLPPIPTEGTATWTRGNDIHVQKRSSLRTRSNPTHLAQHIFQFPRVMHIYDAHGNRMSIDKLLTSEPEKWYPALSNEWG